MNATWIDLGPKSIFLMNSWNSRGHAKVLFIMGSSCSWRLSVAKRGKLMNEIWSTSRKACIQTVKLAGRLQVRARNVLRSFGHAEKDLKTHRVSPKRCLANNCGVDRLGRDRRWWYSSRLIMETEGVTQVQWRPLEKEYWLVATSTSSHHSKTSSPRKATNFIYSKAISQMKLGHYVCQPRYEPATALIHSSW